MPLVDAFVVSGKGLSYDHLEISFLVFSRHLNDKNIALLELFLHFTLMLVTTS